MINVSSAREKWVEGQGKCIVWLSGYRVFQLYITWGGLAKFRKNLSMGTKGEGGMRCLTWNSGYRVFQWYIPCGMSIIYRNVLPQGSNFCAQRNTHSAPSFENFIYYKYIFDFGEKFLICGYFHFRNQWNRFWNWNSLYIKNVTKIYKV